MVAYYGLNRCLRWNRFRKPFTNFIIPYINNRRSPSSLLLSDRVRFGTAVETTAAAREVALALLRNARVQVLLCLLGWHVLLFSHNCASSGWSVLETRSFLNYRKCTNTKLSSAFWALCCRFDPNWSIWLPTTAPDLCTFEAS